MSKQYNIRWGRSDYSRLSHLVRKVNRKVFEIEVKRPDIAGYQPAMLDYSELKEQIKTRQDFNRLMNKYNRYLREGAEEIKKSDRGAVATNFEIKEFEIAQRAENVRRANMRKKLGEEDVTIAGKSTGVKRAEMGSVLNNATKPSKKKFNNMSQGDWKHAFQEFEKKMRSTYNEEMRADQLRRYVKGLIAEGYSDELLQILNKVSPEDFDRVFYSDETATIDFIYDPLDLRVKQDSLIELWEQYVDDNVDNKLDIIGITEEVKYEYENGMRIKGTGRLRTKRRRR